MKKIIALALFIVSYGQAQVIKDFPVDSNGNIHYEKVMDAPGATSPELFLKSKEFFVNSFKSANSVIQLEDKESATVIGKGNSEYHLTRSTGTGTFYFTIKIQSKDARYKYEIYDIKYYVGALQKELPAEDLFRQDWYYDKNGKPKKTNLRYKEELERTISNIQDRIEAAMNGKPELSAKAKDW